jgi:hypothetical protein
MVWIMNVGMKPAYVCDACGSGYRDPKVAISCEEYCKKNKACSTEISKKAVYKP